MEKKREVFDFASELASLRPQLIRRARARWPKEFWREQSPEDFASEAICLVYAKRDTFRGSFVAELAEYSQRTLDRLIANCWRQIKARGKQETLRPSKLPRPSGTTPSKKLMRKETGEKVAGALESLPRDQKRICELIHLDEASYGKASEAMQKPGHTLYRLMRKAMEALRRRLAKQYASHT
jgi:RNA polymerase sigma factor (sigma-70 family)